jgi:type VI protein secretion system component Hcp
MSIFMKIDAINGSATHSGYDGWISLKAVDFSGIIQPVHQIVGRMKDRLSELPIIGQVEIIKQVDDSSLPLFQAASSAKVIHSVEIDFVTSGDHGFTYEKLELSDVIISHYREKHRDGIARPYEYLWLSYVSINKTFYPRGADNTPGAPVRAGYDLSSGTRL